MCTLQKSRVCSCCGRGASRGAESILASHRPHFSWALHIIMMARWLACASLLATCNAAGLAASCKLFKACRQGETVDVPSFAAATDEYLKFLDSFGKWTAASIGETRSCLQKLEDGIKKLRSSGTDAEKARKLQTLLDILTAEQERGLHKPGGKLADPSATMGLLWVRRGLAFWAKLFALEVARISKTGEIDGGPGTFRQQVQVAYKEVIDPFHGWVSRKAFMLSMRRAPEWNELRRRAGLPCDSCDALRGELQDWCETVSELMNRMQKAHQGLDLEDTRRSV